MTEYTSAERHAGTIEYWARGESGLCGQELRDAAAELRRLHARVQELERELVVEAGRAAQLRLTVSNLDHQHAMQAAMNSEARNELAAIRARGAQGESNAE